MQILHFTTLDSISPVYYDKTYHAVPEAGGDKAFELLRTAMLQEQVVAVAKTVLVAMLVNNRVYVYNKQ